MVSRFFNALAVTFLTSHCTVLLCRGVYVAAMGEGKCLCLREMWSILFRFFFFFAVVHNVFGRAVYTTI